MRSPLEYIVWIGSEDKSTEAAGHAEEVFEASFFGYDCNGRSVVWQILFYMCIVHGIRDRLR